MSNPNLKKVTEKSLEGLEQRVVTGVTNALKSFLDRGYTVLYDEHSCVGVATKHGIDIKFTVGGENLYFSIETHTKWAHEETVSKLDELVRFSANYQC